MARVRLTEAYIKGLPLPAAHHAIHHDQDVRGLAVRITQSGARSFLFCYSFDGRERRMSLGPWSPLVSNKLGSEATRKAGGSLAWAKHEAARLRALVQTGVDPMEQKRGEVQQRKAAKQQAAREMTVEALAEKYIAEHVPEKRSGAEDERRLRAFVIPVWGARKAKEISRADVDQLVTPVAKGGRGVPPRKAEARQRLALVRKMFSFAVDKGIVDHHPCLRMKAPGGKIAPRTRALTTPKELRILWRVTEPDSVWTRTPKRGRSKYVARARRFTQAEADALRLVLLTGARASEVTDLPWAEIDLDAGTWLLPAARSKNKRANLLPLLPEAVTMLRRRRTVATGAYVFPGKHIAHLTAGHLQRPLKQVCERLASIGLASFTTHDLRRTVETGMAAAKVPKEYRDRVLNHVDASVGGQHYNMYDYADEKQEALEKWARRLEGMLTGVESNVVPLRRSAR